MDELKTEIKKAPTDIKQVEQNVVTKLATSRDSAYERFPLLFMLLASFGLVATFYGFEGIIDQIDALANNPFILLCIGLTTLIITGTLYKKLG
jgi:predicted ABC-type sugar transport system permease subunit